MEETSKPFYIVSGCLVGLCTRYDGEIKEYSTCINILSKANWIPVCPEQLGGLPTPREAADIHDGDGHDVLAGTAKVITKSGEDITPQFISGARQVLQIAKMQNITKAILKARSPSCAASSPVGVTCALLRENGIVVDEI